MTNYILNFYTTHSLPGKRKKRRLKRFEHIVRVLVRVGVMLEEEDPDDKTFYGEQQ